MHSLGPRLVLLSISIAAGSTGDVVVPNPFDEEGAPSARVASFSFMPTTADPLDGTNFATLTLRDLGDTTDLSEALSNETVAFAKGVGRSAALKNESGVEVNAGGSVLVKKTEDGTGGDTVGTLLVRWLPSRGAI